MVSAGVGRLALAERSEQMGFSGCILIACYVFPSGEVDRVLLFHSVYVFLM